MVMGVILMIQLNIMRALTGLEQIWAQRLNIAAIAKEGFVV